ncbi:POU domain, class 6, transcription factor 1 [Neosynchiropus ocellatus]
MSDVPRGLCPQDAGGRRSMSTSSSSVKNEPLTVNEQVIVMSGQETIRVLEVEVPPSLDVKSESERRVDPGKPDAALDPAAAAVADRQAVSTEAPPPVPVSPTQAHTAAPAATPIGVQSCPQVLTQESLASLMTGMLAQTNSLASPLLIPLSMAGSLGGQGALALLTLPNTNMATIQSLAAAVATPTGNLLKLPFAGLPGAAIVNPVQNAQPLFQPLQPGAVPPQVSAAQLPAATAASQPSISVAALPTAGLSINPAIINAASLGAQTQFLSSLTSTPIITSAGMAGITGQIITNAQGQVVGTLPVLVNPASLTGGGAAPALPLQGLQVQTVAPQLLVNTQGHIIAAVGNGAAPSVATTAAVLPKPAAPPVPSKPSTQAMVTAVTQTPVAIAPNPAQKPGYTSGPLNLVDMVKAGELSKTQKLGSDDGINLEEIREFAKNFKIRRLSLGLTQTQVGQALTATEGPAYSQSAICRFEKLDITPKSAQKLKPVLEKWLAEAEHWNQKGQQDLMEFVGGEPSKKRKRRTSFTPQAIEVLNSYFEKNALPTGQEITQISRELNYDREVVRVWFCNRRQTLKNTSKINAFQVSL